MKSSRSSDQSGVVLLVLLLLVAVAIVVAAFLRAYQARQNNSQVGTGQY